MHNIRRTRLYLEKHGGKWKTEKSIKEECIQRIRNIESRSKYCFERKYSTLMRGFQRQILAKDWVDRG